VPKNVVEGRRAFWRSGRKGASPVRAKASLMRPEASLTSSGSETSFSSTNDVSDSKTMMLSKEQH